ncbi:MAG: cytochrome c biogenesis protein CcdA [Methylococcales bacterium]
MMKNFIAIFLMGLLTLGLANADIPKATLSMTPVNTQTWPTQYQLSLSVPADHHVYLQEGDEHIYIPVTVDPDAALANAGLTVVKLDKPVGVYDSLVKAQVLRESGEFTLWLDKAGASANVPSAKAFNLTVRYQMCNEVTNVCYRPQLTSVDLPLPPVAETLNAPAANTVAAQAEDSGSFMDKLLALFQDNHDNTLIMFGLMFIAGLLSVATPCVYPMLPITSMFIVNRANGVPEKEKQHAFVYLIGIVGTYMLLGLVAGMSGGAFNTLMQSAWVNIGFALFFAFFALALLGFYELGFMQNEVHSLDQQSSKVKGLTGTWLMGTVAGLVISPCVGPIVFALLLQVADNIAAKADALALLNQQLSFWDKFGISAQGSMMMAGFGLGVGLPFFFISVMKFKKLPKAGYWMNKVKYGFGFAILYFAFNYLEKGMGVLGVEHSTTLTLVFGMLGVWIAIVHCNVFTLLPEDVQPNQKMIHYCGVMSMLIGGWLMFSSLGQMPGINSAHANAAGLSPIASADANANVIATKTAAPVEQEAGISWYRNFAAAQQMAKQTGKPVFIDFYASWCSNCVAFKAETANNSELNQALREKAIAVKLIDKEPDFEAFREDAQHRQLKIGLPYFAILTPDGKLSWSGTDYKAAQKMVAELTKLSV